MEIDPDTLLARIADVGSRAFDTVAQPAVLYQLVIVAVLFVVSLLLASRVEPKLEAQARNIKGYPGLLRLVIAFLRRIEWVAFVLLLGIALALVRSLGWPESD